MFHNNVADHKLKVEAIIKNINTISLELKKMKDLHRMHMPIATLAKENETAKTSSDQPELAAGAGERSTSDEIQLSNQEEERSDC